ncbi:hypothetical protein AUK13_02330 [Candidatus Kuenenbacteria bacterium CG2_30_39_24]|uniref:Uncharacterized protein n=2 Tax=Candidatus Kueneniibacteriota TaxID=1752740 RepID=A0A2G9Z7R8_9BACT|nr:MAG: hypothetical protein AUK13_02330 [Candidatus Kuenenbacteria bacterium CG2_30_39_24]PIP29203.1 MAG: hypothetical protein COX28_00345 [Candidatus Kuenenbacteria bacterium CG23_combo_of_CG06-09_8_20_14_all_39_39]
MDAIKYIVFKALGSNKRRDRSPAARGIRSLKSLKDVENKSKRRCAMSTSQKTSGLWTMTKGEFEESVSALEKAVVKQGGNPRDLFDLFRTDGEYACRIAQAMMRKGLVGSIESRLARLVLGRNIFDDADWMSYYDAKFTKKQFREAGKFPWGEDILNSSCPFNSGKLVKDTHFAFLGLTAINGSPLTVAKWLELHPATGQPKFYFNNDPWHVGQPHTDVATMQLRWYLMLKDIIPDSTSKTPEEQVAMLPPEYEVPSTIAEVTKDILVFRKTDVRPNPSHWAACTERTVKTDKVSAGRVSCVGGFDGDGLYVDVWCGDRVGSVGLGASRKF